MIESEPLRKTLEQERLHHEYEVSGSPSSLLSPTTHQLVSCLAIRGQWVTTQPNLQLDPPRISTADDERGISSFPL